MLSVVVQLRDFSLQDGYMVSRGHWADQGRENCLGIPGTWEHHPVLNVLRHRGWSLRDWLGEDCTFAGDLGVFPRYLVLAATQVSGLTQLLFLLECFPVAVLQW